jgi:hypothetical protein
VFARVQGRLDDSGAFIGMEGNIHDLDVISSQQFAIVGEHFGVRVKLGAALFSASGMAIAERGDVESKLSIRSQVVFRNPAAADQRNLGSIISRERRSIGQHGCGEGAAGSGAAETVAVFWGRRFAHAEE